MDIRYENENFPLRKNAFIEKGRMGVYGWYGLNHLEISDTNYSDLNIDDLKDLRDCLNVMIKEIEVL